MNKEEREALGMLKAIELTNVYYTLYDKDESKKAFISRIAGEAFEKRKIELLDRQLESIVFNLDTPALKEVIDYGMKLFEDFRNGNPGEFVKYSLKLNREYQKEIYYGFIVIKFLYPELINTNVVSTIIARHM